MFKTENIWELLYLPFFLFSLSLFKLPIIKNDTSFEKHKTCKGQKDIFHPPSLILQK